MKFKIDQNLQIEAVDLMAKAIPMLAVRPINGRLWIVEPNRLRIRGGE